MDFLDQLRARLTALLTERSAAHARAEAVLAAVAAEARSALTDAENVEFDMARADIARIDTETGEVRQRIEQLEAAHAANERAQQTLAELAARSTAEPRSGGARVTGEPAAYRSGGASFFADLAARHNDPDAAERLGRHSREVRGVERRDGTTANFSGLIPPAYLTDLVAPLLRGGRPFADLCRKAPLTATGMTVNISRITTGSSTAVQATQNTALSETDIDDTLLTVDVRTVGGMQDISRQSLDRGVGIDEIIIQDLAGSYAVTIDTQVISGDGTAGTMLGVLSTPGIVGVTYTDASPTVAELYPKLADAIQQITGGRFLPPSAIVMHPRRWGWFTSALDSSSRPLVLPMAQYNPMGEGSAAAGYGGPVGILHGLPVYTDAAIPTNLGAGTNEDRIIIARMDDLVLWEEPGSPLRVRLDEPGGHTLTVRYVLWGYAAFTAGRYPGSTAVISGTGLIAPTF